jgi:uncharacterized protein
MRTKSPITALMPERRAQILSALIMHPNKSWYLHELAESLKTSPSSLQRELQILSEAGILNRQKSGNRVYYTARQDSPIFPELKMLFTKTTGVVDVLRDSFAPFRRQIKLAFIYGSVASGTETPESDVDVFIVGDTTLWDLAPCLQQAEKMLGREVNPVVFTEKELRKKLKTDNNFLNQVSGEDVLFIFGDSNAKAKSFGQ